MKKKIIVLGILGFIMCSAFNKPALLITDYRDMYCGTYNCKGSTRLVTVGNTRKSTTINETTNILVSKDVQDSVLQISIMQNTYKMKLSKGILYPTRNSEHCGGSFYATDSLGIMVTHGHAGTSSYAGKKAN